MVFPSDFANGCLGRSRSLRRDTRAGHHWGVDYTEDDVASLVRKLDEIALTDGEAAALTAALTPIDEDDDVAGFVRPDLSVSQVVSLRAMFHLDAPDYPSSVMGKGPIPSIDDPPSSQVDW